MGQRKLIVHTVARDPNVQLRINPAGVEKMSDVLLRFAEPILDRLAPLDDKKATLLFAMSAWNRCLISSEEQAHMCWELRHIFDNAHNRADFEMHSAKNGTLPAQPATVHGSRSGRECRQVSR
ncbi:MAG: hypothetical protein WA869_17195 [Alloacidobacterium sp.]